MKKICLLYILLLPFVVNAQDSLLTAYTAAHKFSGNVLIARNGKIVLEKAYGYANVDKKQLNDLETEFRAGSLTKMLTSTLILQLMEEGKIRLDEPVNKYVPGFAAAITIRNLLSHTSGIRGNTAPNALTLKELVEGFKSDQPGFNPGDKFEYNNFNYILLGYIAEKLTRQSYASLVQRRIFDKAGMIHSGFDFEGRPSTDKATGYQIDPATRLPVKAVAGNVAAAGSAGSLYTTVSDLYKWSQAISSNTLLSAKTYQLAFTPVIGNYGLGWIRSDIEGHEKIGHTGSIEGFMADFTLFPKDGVAIIFLSNLQTMVDYRISDLLTAITFNLPYTEIKDKVAITLPESILARYTGTYENNGDKMVVFLKDGKLLVLAPQGDTVELTPETENKFYIKGPDIGVEFRENAGKQTMFIDMRGGMTFTKTR